MKHSIRRLAPLALLALVAALLAGVLTLPPVAGVATPLKASAGDGTWDLRILHASDQEAGKKALIDIPGMVAVMDKLDKLPYPNTLKLTSGDLFISGPFMDASKYLYSRPVHPAELKVGRSPERTPAMRPGIADVIINNGLGWQAAAIGNHEFDGFNEDKGVLNAHNFFALIAADPALRNGDGVAAGADAASAAFRGAGLGSRGYPGAAFPYLSVNLEFDSFRANRQGDGIFKAYGLNDHTARPQVASGNTLARSTTIKLGTHQVGVIGATTPFLPDIVGGFGARHLRLGSYRSKEASAPQQAAALKPLIVTEVEALEQQGINAIVLMTHLQDSGVEQELSRQLAADGIGVDVVIGGGSHKVMGPANGAHLKMLRGLDQSSVIDPQAKARQEVVPALLPYPQSFKNDASGQLIYYVNGGANYEYLNQLVVRFDRDGRVVGHDPVQSRPWKTDEDGVIDLLGKSQWRHLPRERQRELIKKHILMTARNPGYRNVINTVDAVGRYINGLDRVTYGMSKVWLNGVNGDVRSRETNLGNLVADSLLWYGQELKKVSPSMADVEHVDVAFISGGCIRDMIGTQQVMPDDSVRRLPPEANPVLGKLEGEISKLDILNSLRFENVLAVGTISSEQLKRSLEAMVAEPLHGGFGQVSGLRFAYDPTRPKGSRVLQIDLTSPYRRADGRIDGGRQDQAVIRPLMRNGQLLHPRETLGLVTLDYLAGGADGQAGAQLTQHFNAVHWLGKAGDPSAWQHAGQPVPTVIPESEAPISIRAGVLERQLGFGTDRDAVAAYLAANHSGDGSGNPFQVADSSSAAQTPGSRIAVIQAS